MQLSGGDRDSLADLTQFTITLPAGDQVPLDAVATVESTRGFAPRPPRRPGGAVVTIRGDLDTDVANADEILADTRARFLPGLETRYPGLAVALEGQAEEAEVTGASLQRNFLIGLAAVFLLLCFQFRSYVEPVLVMAVIPTGLVGVIWGHYVFGLELSMPSMVRFRVARRGGGEQLHRAGGVHQAPPARRGVGRRTRRGGPPGSDSGPSCSRR